jgi:iron complex outermembrane receptor protein
MDKHTVALGGVLALALMGPMEVAGQTGAIEGRTVNAETGAPVTGVEVTLAGTDRGTLSDGDGRFVMDDVPAGPQTVVATTMGYRAEEKPIRVGLDQRVEVLVELSEQAVELGGIRVVARRGGLVAREAATAMKVAAPRLETAQSVSVITGAQFAKQDVASLSEAARYSPGVQTEPWGFEPRLTFIRIRGFDATTTGLYRDGLALRNPGYAVGYNLEPYGAERIEVLRGPSSVLYGAGSPGGLVNYVAKRPTSVPIREVEVEAGSYEMLVGKADLAGPVGADGRFGYRLTALVRESGTQVDFVNNDRIFVAPTFTWQPGDRTTLTVLGHYKQDATRASQALPAAGVLTDNPNGTVPVDRFTGEPDIDQYDRTDYTAGYIFDHEFAGGLRLHQNLRYYDISLDDRTIFTQGIQADNRTITRFLYESFGDAGALAVDNQARLEGTTGPLRHALVVGFDYQTLKATSRQTYGGAPGLDIFDPEYGQTVPEAPVFLDNETEQWQAGLYVQDRIELGGGLIASLAGRYDRTGTEVFSKLYDTTTSQEDEAFTARAGLVYRTALGLAPYASYAESFLPSMGSDSLGTPFDPETGTQYEAGVKYEPALWNGFVRVSYFDLTRNDFIQYDPNTYVPVQTGQVVSRGGELEAVAALQWGLDLLASFTYADVEVTESIVQDEIGKRPTQTPALTASLWADYSLPAESVLGGLGLGGGVRHVGSTYGDAANTLEVPAHTLVDGSLSYAWGDFLASVTVKNVLDEAYVAAAFLRSTPLATYGQARTITTSLRYRW